MNKLKQAANWAYQMYDKHVYRNVAPGGVREAEQEYQDKVYERQRRDNLADWNRVNAYNHPLEQMNRLRQAGLNPNLIYGKGADTTASSIQSAQPGRVNFTPSQLPQQIAGLVQNIRMNKAQVDNVTANTQVAMANKAAIDANIMKTMQETARSKFDLAQAQALRDGVIERQKLDNQLLGQSFILNVKNYDLGVMASEINKARLEMDNARLLMDKKKSAQEIKESGQRIKESMLRVQNMSLQNDYQKLKNQELFPLEKKQLQSNINQTEQNISNLKTAGDISFLDLNLRKNGINPQDPFYVRMFMQNVEQSNLGKANNDFVQWSNDKYYNKSDNQKLYDLYNKQGGFKGTGMTWIQFQTKYGK